MDALANEEKIRHDFSSHWSMTMPALNALAHRLDKTGQCRHISPDAVQASAFDHQAGAIDGRGIDEVFDQIDQPGAWLALYNVESDPEYAAFLDEVRVEFEPLIAHEQTGLYNIGGFIFISCAPSVTPFHIDRENNFWLQIKGRKTISVWPANNPVPEAARTEPSISVGIVFYSDETRQQARVFAFNRLLRRGGLSPRPPRVTLAQQLPTLRDRAKAIGGLTAVRLMTRLREYSPPPGL